jgi:hypothetical protein
MSTQLDEIVKDYDSFKGSPEAYLPVHDRKREIYWLVTG